MHQREFSILKILAKQEELITSVEALYNQRAVTAHCDDLALLRKESEQLLRLFPDPNILRWPGFGC